MKRKIIALILIVLAAAAVILTVFLVKEPTEKEENKQPVSTGAIEMKADAELEKAISEAIISDNKGTYESGEFDAEGHIILGIERKDEKKVTVYVLMSYSSYGFENGDFVSFGGCGSVPAVFTFDEADGKYSLSQVKYAEDGGNYITSVRKMFPEKIAIRVVSNNSGDSNELTSQCVSQAEKYLESIGREAKIGEISERTLFPSDVALNDDAYNRISALIQFPFPDYYIGTRELIENGERMVYETAYDEESKKFICTKSKYDSGETLSRLEVDAQTGEIISENGLSD